uniref:DFDF domain-containing protein n=1 Tax=Manihot esculenta TaxID=3983 RepID=A0A2C9WBA4_MANES
MYVLINYRDFQDLQVKTPLPAQTEETIHDDPAIIQSHYIGVPLSSSASHGGKTLIESAQRQDMSALTSRGYPTSSASLQPVNHVSSTNLSNSIEDCEQSTSMSMYWQGYNGTTINRSHASQYSIPFQPHPWNDSPIMELTKALEIISPVSSVASNNSIFTPVQNSLPRDVPSFSSNTSYGNINRLTTSLVPYFGEYTYITNVENVGKSISDAKIVYTAQSTPSLVSSYGASTFSSLLTPSPSLSIEGLSHLSFLIQIHEKFLVVTFLSALCLINLALNLNLYNEFTEEFDFEVMNEKFKRDEVWIYLEKANQGENIIGDKEAPHLVPHFDAKTFSWFNQRYNMVYGGWDAGHVNYYHGRYNWGRGYDGRGNGNKNLPY